MDDKVSALRYLPEVRVAGLREDVVAGTKAWTPEDGGLVREGQYEPLRGFADEIGNQIYRWTGWRD